MIDSCQSMFHEIHGDDSTVVVSVDGMIDSCQSMFHDSSYDTAVIVFINGTVVGL